MNSIVQYLLAAIPGASLVAGDKQILCRCPICMDSANPNSAHFYIGPMKDQTKPLQYNCKKCNSSGIFSSKTLQTFGIYDLELATIITEYNNKVMNSPEWMNAMTMEGVIHRITIPQTIEDSITNLKIRYINERIGTNLSLQEIVSDKIVLNLYDLFNSNHNITTFTRGASIVEQLNKYFIGFMSYDNGYLNMRRLCGEGKVYDSIDKRYINYNIFNTIDNSKRFYVIPNNVDLLDPNPIDVWIAEGPFDALSIKYNVSPNPARSIFISAGGKGYLLVVKFLFEYLGLINIRLHLCPDGDVKDYDMYNIANYIRPFMVETYMHRNVYPGEKDFGVPRSNIRESIIQI